MPKASHRLILPQRVDTSVVFASPHSGRQYPRSFLARAMLGHLAVRSSEDAFVDRLFDAATARGAPLLLADAPRAFVDLNRAATELDPSLIEGVRRAPNNPRVTSGLGVIPRVVSNGRPIYRGKIPLAEAEARIADCWHPYHTALQGLLDDARRTFRQAILIDCHSMPHEAIENVGTGFGRRPDVVLGDRFGAAAAPWVTSAVQDAFQRAGLRVARNAPFAGAYITQHYGRPSRRQHVVQVELDRALYMDETTIEPTADFAAFKRLIDGVVAELADIGRASPALPVAAE